MNVFEGTIILTDSGHTYVLNHVGTVLSAAAGDKSERYILTARWGQIVRTIDLSIDMNKPSQRAEVLTLIKQAFEMNETKVFVRVDEGRDRKGPPELLL